MRHQTDTTDILKPELYFMGYWLMKSKTDEYVVVHPNGSEKTVNVDFQWVENHRHGYNYYWIPNNGRYDRVCNVDIEGLFAQYVRLMEEE